MNILAIGIVLFLVIIIIIAVLNTISDRRRRIPPPITKPLLRINGKRIRNKKPC